MWNDKPDPLMIQDEPFRPEPVLRWAMCHPGVLLLSSLAVGTMLTYRRKIDQQTIPDRRVESEADIVEGDIPLFV
jgi:hypothetical protein